GGDDENGERRGGGQEDGEVGVLAEVLERFLRTVRGGRQPVGAEPDPGEEGRQRDVAEQMRVLQVLRPSKQDALEPLDTRRSERRRRLRSRGSCRSDGVHLAGL